MLGDSSTPWEGVTWSSILLVELVTFLDFHQRDSLVPVEKSS